MAEMHLNMAEMQLSKICKTAKSVDKNQNYIRMG
jgi:hypothetical protein